MGTFKHHKYFPKAKEAQAYLFPHVCLACHKSFKKPFSAGSRLCPQCGGNMIRLSRKFAAPKTSDTMQWRKIELLVQSGFRFHPVYEQHGNVKLKVPYPRTLAEAQEFVQRDLRELG